MENIGSSPEPGALFGIARAQAEKMQKSDQWKVRMLGHLFSKALPGPKFKKMLSQLKLGAESLRLTKAGEIKKSESQPRRFSSVFNGKGLERLKGLFDNALSGEVGAKKFFKKGKAEAELTREKILPEARELKELTQSGSPDLEKLKNLALRLDKQLKPPPPKDPAVSAQLGLVLTEVRDTWLKCESVQIKELAQGDEGSSVELPKLLGIKNRLAILQRLGVPKEQTEELSGLVLKECTKTVNQLQVPDGLKEGFSEVKPNSLERVESGGKPLQEGGKRDERLPSLLPSNLIARSDPQWNSLSLWTGQGKELKGVNSPKSEHPQLTAQNELCEFTEGFLGNWLPGELSENVGEVQGKEVNHILSDPKNAQTLMDGVLRCIDGNGLTFSATQFANMLGSVSGGAVIPKHANGFEGKGWCHRLNVVKSEEGKPFLEIECAQPFALNILDMNSGDFAFSEGDQPFISAHATVRIDLTKLSEGPQESFQCEMKLGKACSSLEECVSQNLPWVGALS